MSDPLVEPPAESLAPVVAAETVGPDAVAEPTASPSGARLARNLTALSIAELVARGLAFLTSVVVARELGPTVLGEVALAQTLVLYFGALGDGGLTLLTQRQIVRTPAQLSALVVRTTAVQLALAGIIVGLLASAAVVAPVTPRASELLLLFSPYAVSQAFSTIYALQALERMTAAAAARIVTQLVTAAGTILLVIATQNAVWVAVMLWMGQLAGDLLAIAVLRRVAALRLTGVSLRGLGPLVRAGLPFLGSVAVFHYAQVFDVISLGLWRDSRDVGLYSAAARLVGSAYLLVLVVMNAVYPEMVRRFQTGPAELERFTEATVRLAFRVTIVPTTLVVVEASELVRAFLGPNYRESAGLLAVLVLLVPAGWCVGLVGQALVAAHLERQYFVGFAVGAAFATVTYPLAAWRIGPMGVAVAAVGAVVASAVMFLWVAFVRIGLRALRMLGPELIAAAVLLALTAGVALLINAPALVVAVWAVGAVTIELVRGKPTWGELSSLRGH